MVSGYNVAICREDKNLIQNLAHGNFSKTAVDAYCLTILRSPEIAEIVNKYGLTKKSFSVIAVSLVNAIPDQCIVVGGLPMLMSTLFFIEPERFSALCEDIQQELGYGWGEEIGEGKAMQIIGICFSHVERAYGPYLVSGKVMGIKQAAQNTTFRLSSGCTWVIAIVVVLVLFFSCRG